MSDIVRQTKFGRLQLQMDHGVARVRIGAGIITVSVLGEAYSDAMRQLAGEMPAIYLCDFRAPVWAVSVAELGRQLDGAAPAACAPAAMVVTAATYPMFRAHAWEMARRGIMRTVFTDYAAAERWAQLRLTVAARSRTTP